ncbi:MAG: hypothetical protein ABSE15_06680 [Candidatus Bathyarchaeia archaeon]
MSGERFIYAGIFFLLFVGLAIFGGWGVYTALHNNMVLAFAGIALICGIILLALYVVFKQLSWEWWS